MDRMPRVHSFSVLCFPTGETHITSDMCFLSDMAASDMMRRIDVFCSRRHIEVNPVISNASTVKFLSTTQEISVPL